MPRSQTRQGSPADDVPPWERDGDAQPEPEPTSTEVVQGEVIPSTGEVIPLGQAGQTVIQWCADHSTVGDNDTAAAMEEIIRRVLASDTPDQVLAESLSVPVEDILNIPVQLIGVRVGETEYADGWPYYALMDCLYGNPPEPRVVTCGAFKVMAQLCAFDRLAAFPQVVMFKEADKATRAGYKPIQMVRVKT